MYGVDADGVECDASRAHEESESQMKTVLKTTVIFLGCLALLGTGFWLGTSHRYLSRLWASSVVSQSTTRAAMLSSQLGQVHEGKIDELARFLNVQLEGEIVTLDLLIDWENPGEGDLTAIRILRTIAKQRADFGYTSPDAAVAGRLNTILEKAQAYPTTGNRSTRQQ